MPSSRCKIQDHCRAVPRRVNSSASDGPHKRSASNNSDLPRQKALFSHHPALVHQTCPSDANPAISLDLSHKHFSRLFHDFGLPNRIRTDNGVPFASSALARLSALSVWFINLGIYPEAHRAR